MSSGRDLRNAACEAADRGWHVIPLRPGAKQPATRHGLKDATDDLVTVFQWWERTPRANIGIVCEPSGLVTLDVDPRHGGEDTLADAERSIGALPPTVSAETGGGGWHYVFRHPGGALRGQAGPGLDIKSHGYILISPSVHPSGRLYEWDNHPDDVEVADLPRAWVEAIVANDTWLGKSPRTVGPQASPDPLRRIPAATYVARITGREPDARGWFTCPFHGGGEERTPSLKVDGHLWACYACSVQDGKRCAGGNIYAFMGQLMGLPLPIRGADYLEVKDALRRLFG